MRNFLLFVFFSLISFISYGQFNDACPGGPDGLTFPTVGITHSEVCNLTAAFNDEADYIATSLVAPINTGFYSFTVNQTDFYRISVIASGAPAATGTLSVGFGTGGCPPIETHNGNIVTGFDITLIPCQELISGTTYYLAFALQDANAGQFTVNITRGGIDVCESAAPAVEDPAGLPNLNILDNSCYDGPNANGPGTIWSTYTVGPETPNEHITVNLSTTAIVFAPGSPSVISVWLNGCPGIGEDVTGGSVTCLSAGDVLYIETGNITGGQGTYNLNIDQFYDGEPNDDCADLTAAIPTLTCDTDITGAGDPDACPDPVENVAPFCGANNADAVGVWYRFNVHASVHEWSFTGSNFRVFTGANCGALTTLGCDGSVAVQNIVGDPTVTYWVLVFGSGSFTASSDVAVPVNDDCADAFTLTNGINGYNACATADFSYCGLNATSHTVHYEYENTTGTYQDLSITVNGQAGVDYPAATQVSVAVLADCGGTTFQGITPICNTLGAPFAVDCIPPGETFILVVGSQDAQEGGFTINFTTSANPVANDMCDGAVDLGTIPTDCIEETNPGNNVGACQDNYSNAGCNFNQNGFHGVWYQFTTDSRADLADIQTTLSNAIFALYTGNCNALTYVAGSCSGSGSIDDVNINPNTTYYLLISSATESANFNIGITIKNIPANDLCNNATTLVNGIEGTNSCATAQLSYCGLNGTTSHDVFYTYTNNTGSNIDLEVTVSASTATSGTAASNVSVAILSACPNTQFPSAAPECNTLGTEFTVACIEDGETVIFAIGSPDGAQGDFTIDFNVVSNSPANDECIDATPLTYDACEWETFNGTNANACPEDFTAGACDFDQQAVVWYSFVATADATSVDFRNLTGAGTPFLGLFNNTANCNLPTAVAGASCVTANAGPFNITGGNTYLIAFGGDAEGAFSFEMRVNEDKANDDPCAPGFAPAVVTAGNTIDDNTCASPDFTICGVTPTEGKTLFYRYTMTQNADLQINVAGSGLNPAGGPIFIGAYETSVGCNNESNYINEDCTGELIIPCLSTGDVVIIMIATGENAGEFGQFTLTITQNTPPRPANDECFNASPIVYDNADLCQWVEATSGESNVNGCTEASDFGTGCDYDLEEVVWFTFTAPSNTDPGSDLSIQFQNYSGTGQLFTTVFNQSANCANLTPISACLLDLGPHGAIATVNPNTTYLIGVGSTGDAGGTFNIEINITSGPPNDDACEDLSAYDLTGGGTLNNQTNLCSSPGGNFPECPADDQTNAVFYTFTISAPNYGIRLVVAPSNTNGTPIDYPMVGGISEPDGTFCPPGAYTPPAICSDDGIFEFTCLEEGDYQFKFSTSEPNSGDFIITSFMLQQNLSCSQTSIADACEDAGSNVISGFNLCEPFAVAGCNTSACPEDFNYGGCDFGSLPVIWYSFTTPDGEGITLDIRGFRAENGSGFMAVFTAECPIPASALSDCIPSNDADVTGIALEGNTTYYIAIGNTNGVGGSFDFSFTLNAPPINDSPCPTWPNPPIDLSGSGGHAGTTCCSIGYNDDSSQDHPNNPDCSTLTQDNSVWYTYEIPADSDGIEINVGGGTIGGNPVVEVYFGPTDMGCNGGIGNFLEAYECDGLPTTIRLGPCTEDGEIVWIRVGSSDGECGTFTISVNPAVPECDMPGRTCEDATHAFDLVTDPDYANIYEQCADFCLDLACPDPNAPPGCISFVQSPTVWIQIGTDDVPPTALITSVVSHGLWEPQWSVYYSTTDDCTSLTPLNNFDNTTSCFDGNTTTAIQSDIFTYWIAITANPDGPPIDDPGFTLCAYTRITVLTCIGPEGGCEENDPSLQWEATWRENGGDLNGPFCPGEEVTFAVSFFYDAGESQVDWFHGIIPDFGPGWDLLNFDWEASMPVGNGTTGTYHEEGSDCEAVVHRTFPHLCTYRDEFGILRMRHIECDDDFTDCLETGLLANQGVLPNGYFWLNNGSSPTCVNGSCKPRDRWGIGSKTATVEWEYTIRVREFDNEQECLENKDLQMSFLAFSDDGAGCWEDSAPCRLDKKQYSPPFEVSCAVPPGVLADNPEICDEGQLNIVVQTDDGSTLDIEITFEPNPNVTGMNNHNFTGGFGTIDDVLSLVNDNCAPEEVWYYARVIDPEVLCEGRVDTIIVTVYPRPEMEQNVIPGECFPSFELYNLEDFITCEGYPGELTMSWIGSNGTSGNTPFIQIDGSFDPGIYTYTVTLTDELGCTNTTQVSIEVYPPVHFTIEDLTLCYDDGTVQVCPDFDEPGTPQYTYLWSFECLPATSADACFQIDPIQILNDCGEDTPLQWDLDLYIFDSHYCEHDTSITIEVNPRPGFVLDPPNPAFCEGANQVEVCLQLDPDVTIEYAEYTLAIGGLVTVFDPPYCTTLTDEGLHSVTVYDAAGCTYGFEFYVGQNIIQPFDILGDTIICIGESTTLTIDGAYDSYSWSTGETTQSITVNPIINTTYSANVIDANGCFSGNAVTVHIVSTSLPALPDTVSFCTGFSTEINAGVGYDLYHWHFGSPSGPLVGTTDTIEVTAEGWYFIEVLRDGCPASDSVYARVDNELSPFVFGDFELCWDQTTTLINATGGAFIDYVWTRTDVLPQQVWQGPTLSSMNLGEGSYELWVSDGNCAGDVTFIVTRADTVIVDILPAVDTVFVCFNGVTNLSATPGFTTYAWNTGQFSQTLTNVGDGVYSVTVTDADGCMASTSIVVFEYPPVSPNLGPTRNICEGDLVVLTPGANFTTYTWYLDGVLVPAWNNQASITVGNGGIYEVVVTNAIGCSNRTSVTVIKTDQLTPFITGNQVICQGMVLALSADQDYFKYTWRNAAGTIIGTSKTVNITIAGVYTLEVESPTGCKGNTQVTVVVNITPTADVDADIKTVCGAGTTNGGNNILDFTQYINSTAPGVWTANNPTSGVVFNANWSVVNFSNVAPGTYTFTYTTTNAIPPCQNVSDVLTVNVVLCNCDPWTINPIADVCTEGSSNIDLNSYLRSTPPGLPMNGSWSVTSGPGGNPVTGNTFNPSAALPGTYTLTFTLTNQGNFCEPSATVTVEVIRAPQIGVVADQPNVCFGTGADFVLETLITGEDTGGTWTEISDRPSTGNAFNAALGTFDTDGQLVGMYKFVYTLTATAPCVSKSITVQININPIPNADAGPDGFACAGGTVQIGGNATSTGTDFTYEWRDQNNAVISTLRTFQVTTSGKYKLTVINTTSGCIHVDSMNVVIYPSYSGVVSGKDLLLDGETDVLRITLIGLTKADVGNYIWYKDGVLIPGANGDTLFVNEAGEYCVDIIPAGADASACVVNACKLIQTELTKEVYIPNIFSPNNDGKNEIFTVEGGKNVAQITNVAVYDRWGELVFLSGSFTLDRKYEFGWNGRFKGQNAIQGVYVYVVDVLYRDDTRETISGDITLIR